MKNVKTASVLFTKEQLISNNNEFIFEDTKRALNNLKGRNLDLIVTCEAIEAFGQTMDTAESLDSPGQYLNLYADFAKSESCTVAGSIKLRHGDNIHNSIVYVGPEGEILGHYDKTYLTDMGLGIGETSGSGAKVVDTPAGKLGGVICFDLQHDDLRQQYVDLKPDILCFSTLFHGGVIQQNWAISCQSYMISSMQFHGGGIMNPFGGWVAQSNCYTQYVEPNASIAEINLDYKIVHLDFNKDSFLDIYKKHGESVKITVPPNLGWAMIESCSPDFSAGDICQEFGLTELRDYLSNMRQKNNSNRA